MDELNKDDGDSDSDGDDTAKWRPIYQPFLAIFISQQSHSQV